MRWLRRDPRDRGAAIGSPGVLLIDGEVAGTWRQRIRGSRDVRVQRPP